jgi:hypothetical protein
MWGLSVLTPLQLLPWHIFISLMIWFLLLWFPFITFYETKGTNNLISERGIIPRDTVSSSIYGIMIVVLVV